MVGNNCAQFWRALYPADTQPIQDDRMRDAAPAFGGWQVDLADHRDYHVAHREVRELLASACLSVDDGRAPGSIDWLRYCPAASEDQRQLSTAAWAGWCLFEYFQYRSLGERPSTSPWFVDRMARRLTGASTGPLSIRQVLKTICLCGMPPAWLDRDAVSRGETMNPLLFIFRSQVAGLRYLRLDDSQATGDEVLDRVKQFLAAGFAVALGLSMFDGAGSEQEIAAPTVFDRLQHGQAVVAVGYDDQRVIRSTRGALEICNISGGDASQPTVSWLPYSYLVDRLARDCWTLLRPQWLASGEFQQPRCVVDACSP